MRLRGLLAFPALLCAGILLAPLSAHALTDVLKVTDLNGTILTDLDGHLAIATLDELAGTGQIGFDVEIPDIVPFSTAGQVVLTEQDPDPVTHKTTVSDLVTAQLLSSSSKVPALLDVVLVGFPNPATRQGVECQTIGADQCLRESGGFQDVTALLFPCRSDLSFRVFVQSEPTPAPVPEPGTLALLGVGLAGLAGCGRRARHSDPVAG